MVDTLKVRQHKARNNVSCTMMFDGGKPTGWMVKCLGDCGSSVDFHYVVLNRSTAVWSCDCPGNQLGGHVCVHIMTIYENELRKIRLAPSFWKTNNQVKRQHRKPFVIQTTTRTMLGVMRKM